jgi:hypothetical protein
MKKVYHNYLNWEDWKHGMFNLKDDNESVSIQKAIDLLSNPSALKAVMRHVAYYWKCSAEMNLTNRNRNRQAWLGQAACCYQYKVPEYLTKRAWHLLSEDQQRAANAVADQVIEAWENYYAQKTIK